MSFKDRAMARDIEATDEAFEAIRVHHTRAREFFDMALNVAFLVGRWSMAEDQVAKAVKDGGE